MSIKVDPRDRFRRGALALVLTAVLAGCTAPATEETGEAPPRTAENWAVTAWGARFEIFPETGALVAGETAVAHTHVTRLDGFVPVAEGEVQIVLAGASGEDVFIASEPVRPGIFNVEITPTTAGDFEVLFRIRDASGVEEIRGGKVRVGTASAPGEILVAPAPRGATDGGEPLDFLKEEQWRSDFATAWVRSGELARSVAGPVRIRPPAGGEAAITSPVDGVVQPPDHRGGAGRGWPHVGLAVDRGVALFRVVPRVAAERSLASLEAELTTLGAELQTATIRLERLEKLLALEATTRHEVDDARLRVKTLDARHTAAARDLESHRSTRRGGTAESFTLEAPFDGEIAEVDTSPGATVAAGDRLARLVRTDLVWLEIALSPAGARQLTTEGVRGVVLRDPEGEPARLEDGVRLVSVAPELSPETGTVTVLLEAPSATGTLLGTTLDAQVLTRQSGAGIVVPDTAVVDDGGVPVVYLQLSGERFVRQEVRVLERQGDLLRVDRLLPGQRLVTRGGQAIRRSSLMSTGGGHGHVH